MSDREDKILQLKTKQEQSFMRSKFGASKDGEFDAAFYAFKHWDKFGPTYRDEPFSSIHNHDIDLFIDTLEQDSDKISLRTIAQDLHYLCLFFRHFNQIELSAYINKRKLKLDAQIREEDKNGEPISENLIKQLYNYPKLRLNYRIIIRLILIENNRISITSLNKILVETVNQETYNLYLPLKDEKSKDKLERIELNPKTLTLAKPILRKNYAKRNPKTGYFQLLTITRREIDKQIKIYSEQACKRSIRPIDIAKFAKVRAQQDLINLLDDATVTT